MCIPTLPDKPFNCAHVLRCKTGPGLHMYHITHNRKGKGPKAWRENAVDDIDVQVPLSWGGDVEWGGGV